jgi:hypothetical protein
VGTKEKMIVLPSRIKSIAIHSKINTSSLNSQHLCSKTKKKPYFHRPPKHGRVYRQSEPTNFPKAPEIDRARERQRTMMARPCCTGEDLCCWLGTIVIVVVVSVPLVGIPFAILADTV